MNPLQFITSAVFAQSNAHPTHPNKHLHTLKHKAERGSPP